MFLFILCFSQLAFADDLQTPRTWTSADGKYKVEAALIAHKDGTVVLRKTNGKITTVDEKQLCHADREYLASRTKRSSTTSKPSTTPVDVTEITTTRLDVDGANVVENLQWSQDGRFLFVLDKQGILNKFSVPGCSKVASIELEGAGSWLTQSSIGLVAVLKSTQELCVVDPDKMKVIHRHKVAGPDKAAGSPKSATLVVTDGSARTMSLVDARTGKVGGTLDAGLFQNSPRGLGIKYHPSSLGLIGFRNIAMVPDGKHVLCVGLSCIYKFSIGRRGLKLVEVGPHIGSNPKRLEVSEDGKYVAMPSGGGNDKVEGHPDVGYGTYIYSTGNLQRAEFGITTGHYPYALSFDTATGLIFAQNHDHQLVVVKKGGVIAAQHKFGERNASTRHLLAHPGGNKLCVLTGKNLYWVEFVQQQ